MEKQSYAYRSISVAKNDLLTGLCSKENFYSQVGERLTHSSKKGRYLVYANIDDFKLVNDLFGRKKGNAILQKTAKYLRELSPHDGLCAHVEADRFFVFLNEQDFSENALNRVSDRLSKSIKRTANPVTLRFGVYKIENPKDSVSVMAGYAKRALKTIKGDAVKRVAYYDNRFLEQKHHEQLVVSEFDRALKERQFKIYLQPQVSSQNALQGAEVLVPPARFIDTLEKIGLIAHLDKNVWEQAAELLKNWQGTPNENLYLSINISTKDFYYLDVYKTLTEIVERYGINPKKLRLEITESVLMNDIDRLIEITKRLHKYGFLIEIDDFGKGYSSLSMLKDIDVDVLKIDMEFLRETEHEEKSRIILASIIEMSRRLGIEVITEGVETAAQKELLESIGCKLFQGYFFDKPMNVGDFEQKWGD